VTELDLGFAIPPGLAADRPPEVRGLERDGVRLLLSTAVTDRPLRFDALPQLLREGDLLVVNESATLPASLPARGSVGEFRLHLSTAYGDGVWLVEPRWDPGRPGPLPLGPGETVAVGGISGRLLSDYPGIRRLCFFRAEGDLLDAMRRVGQPIRYGYLAGDYPLATYQTIFSRVPGSAEMPSAGRPFTARLVAELKAKGVELTAIVLHSGVSSLEEGDAAGGAPPLLPEPFEVPASAADAIERTRSRGGRVIAVGTTVVRALESSFDGCRVRAARGFTRLHLSPDRPVRAIDGLLTGFHDARSTHLSLLAAVAGETFVRRSYRTAVDAGFLWHEFGDVQLILPKAGAVGS
jgi:S-adenosylmethionine:tRNA ribosyltransferase-isomerase